MDARIVTVREDEPFPQPHDAYSVFSSSYERRADSDGYELVWHVVLLTDREDAE